MSAKVVRVRCPECGATGKVRKASLNKKKTCPKCKASIVFQAITSSNHTSSRKIKILVLSGCILFALLSGGYFVVGSIREGLQVRQKLEKAAQEEEQKHLAEEKTS